MNNPGMTPVQNGIAGVVFIVYGTLTPREELSEKTKRQCVCAVFECRKRTRPVVRNEGGKTVVKSSRCPAVFILVSKENTQGARRKTVNQMRMFLVSLWDVPSESIITVEGRRLHDIAMAIIKAKLANHAVVMVRKRPLVRKLSLLDLKFKQNGITTPEYIYPTEQGLRRLAGSKR